MSACVRCKLVVLKCDTHPTEEEMAGENATATLPSCRSAS